MDEASGCADICISADVPDRVTARKTAAAVTAQGAVQGQSVVRLTAAVQQTGIDPPAEPHQPEESRSALHA